MRFLRPVDPILMKGTVPVPDVGKARSVDQHTGFFAQPPQDTRFGEDHCVSSEAQFGCYLVRRESLDSEASIRQPSLLLEVSADDGLKSMEDMAVVFAIPLRCQ